MARILGLTIAILTISVSAFAGSVVAPELDANTALTALTLLAGGAAVLRARFRK